jgi:hypothetical protein
MILNAAVRASAAPSALHVPEENQKCFHKCRAQQRPNTGTVAITDLVVLPTRTVPGTGRQYADRHQPRLMPVGSCQKAIQNFVRQTIAAVTMRN